MKNCHLHLSNGTRSLYRAALRTAQKIVKVLRFYQRTPTCPMVNARNFCIRARCCQCPHSAGWVFAPPLSALLHAPIQRRKIISGGGKVPPAHSMPTAHARTRWYALLLLLVCAALCWALSQRSPFQSSERDIVVAAAVESYDRARLAHRVLPAPEQVEERLLSDNPEGTMTVDTAMRILEDAIARASNLNADDLIKGKDWEEERGKTYIMYDNVSKRVYQLQNNEMIRLQHKLMNRYIMLRDNIIKYKKILLQIKDNILGEVINFKNNISSSTTANDILRESYKLTYPMEVMERIIKNMDTD